MATSSRCTTCGLNGQHCQCHRKTPPTGPFEITPAVCCSCYYFCTLFFFFVPLIFTGLGILFNGKDVCYLELFANSISVSNVTNATNVSNADWRIGFVAMSPVSGCKISLHTIKSRLLRGDEVISELSPSSDFFGQPVTSDETDGPVTTVNFENVVTPGVIGGVVWDFRVEIVAGVKADTGHGLLMVFCGGLPVKFTADAAGNVTGSLLGNIRRCEYLFRPEILRRYV